VSIGLQTSGAFPAAVTAGGVFGLLVALAFLTLNFVAVGRIITKAGYSGWWIILPLLLLVSYVVTQVVAVDTLHSIFSPSGHFDTGGLKAAAAFDGLCLLLNYVFFLIFAFSGWPIEKDLRQAHRAAGQYGMHPPGLLSPYGAGSPAMPGPPTAGAAFVRGVSAGWQAPCPSCKQLNDMGIRFCPSCGVDLGSPPG